jgi:hypothetical protein
VALCHRALVTFRYAGFNERLSTIGKALTLQDPLSVDSLAWKLLPSERQGGTAMETQAAMKVEEPRSGASMEPETILPPQFFDRLRIDASLQPEKRLMLAVLEDAVGTFQKHTSASGRRARRLFSEAEEWFLSDEAEWPFAFVNVCEALGLEPGYMRSGLRRWREEQERSASPKVVRFPFRRVNGRRHSVTGRPVGLRRSA